MTTLRRFDMGFFNGSLAMFAQPDGKYVMAEDCLPMLDLLSNVLRVMQDACPPDGLTDREAFAALWTLMEPWPLGVRPVAPAHGAPEPLT